MSARKSPGERAVPAMEVAGYRVVGLRRADQRVPIECEDRFCACLAVARGTALGWSTRYGWGYVAELARPCRLWLFREGIEILCPQLELALGSAATMGMIRAGSSTQRRRDAETQRRAA